MYPILDFDPDPLATVQVYRQVNPALIRRVTDLGEFSRVAERMFQTGGDSHFRPWLESLGIKYSPEDMVAQRDRIHMFGFDPTAQAGPAPLAEDLIWVLPALLLFLLGVIWVLV
jgi:hypothetical protein